MRVEFCVLMMAVGGMILAGCDRSSPDATGTPQPNPVVRHLDAAGREIHSAATEAATQVKPELERAREEARQELHRGAEKVEQWTTTQPATGPTTEPIR